MTYSYTQTFYVQRENKTKFLIALEHYRFFLDTEITAFEKSFFFKSFSMDNLESYVLCEQWQDEEEFRFVSEQSLRFRVVKEEMEKYSRGLDD